MSDAKHTPGKWQARWLADDNAMEIFTRRGRSICPIATVHVGVCDVDDDGHETPDPDSEDYANARLIKGAPDLLAALEGLTVLTGKLLRQGEGCLYDPWNNGYMQSARAAIAKATT